MAGSRRVFRTPRRHLSSSAWDSPRVFSPWRTYAGLITEHTTIGGGFSAFYEDFYETERMTVLLLKHSIWQPGRLGVGLHGLSPSTRRCSLTIFPDAKRFKHKCGGSPPGKLLVPGHPPALLAAAIPRFERGERLPGLEPYFPQCRHQFNHIYAFS